MIVQQDWRRWLGVVLQLVACLGLFVNAILIASDTTLKYYPLGRECDWEVLFQLVYITVALVIYFPLFALGRLCFGSWGGLWPVWLAGASYLVVQHAFLIFAACGVETP